MDQNNSEPIDKWLQTIDIEEHDNRIQRLPTDYTNYLLHKLHHDTKHQFSDMDWLNRHVAGRIPTYCWQSRPQDLLVCCLSPFCTAKNLANTHWFQQVPPSSRSKIECKSWFECMEWHNSKVFCGRIPACPRSIAAFPFWMGCIQVPDRPRSIASAVPFRRCNVLVTACSRSWEARKNEAVFFVGILEDGS